jgi:hypothetical protein
MYSVSSSKPCIIRKLTLKYSRAKKVQWQFLKIQHVLSVRE